MDGKLPGAACGRGLPVVVARDEAQALRRAAGPRRVCARARAGARGAETELERVRELHALLRGELGAQARAHLREHFLAADAALTGVNFAIAETGGFVVCTNEGNADLAAALAPVHIASMGIEKLIPRAEDLGVFTRLLTRSATGQPVTVYTSHFHGPRRGQEMHLILVDNGRSVQLGREGFWRSLKCIRCAACINTCPVYRRSSGSSAGSSSGTYSSGETVVREEPRTVRKSNTGKGAIIGSAAGAAIGVATSHDKLKGGLLGAVIGGAAGAVIGNNTGVKHVPQY